MLTRPGNCHDFLQNFSISLQTSELKVLLLFQLEAYSVISTLFIQLLLNLIGDEILDEKSIR